MIRSLKSENTGYPFFSLSTPTCLFSRGLISTFVFLYAGVEQMCGTQMTTSKLLYLGTEFDV
jgi:hypothetical protein